MRWLANGLGLDRRFPRTHVWPLSLSIPCGPEAAEDEGYVTRCAELVHGSMQRGLTDLAARRAAATHP